jgi:hypothetical protein
MRRAKAKNRNEKSSPENASNNFDVKICMLVSGSA